MSLSEDIKVLCVRSHISVSELARRSGFVPQNFYAKMKRETFSFEELDRIAGSVGCKYQHYFEMPDGKRV